MIDRKNPFKNDLDLSHCKSTGHALNLAGADWEVKLIPLFQQPTISSKRWQFFSEPRYLPATNPSGNPFMATMRTDNNVLLGQMTAFYKPINNRDAISFLDPLIADGTLIINTIREERGGAKMSIVLSMPGGITIGGDEHDAHIVGSWGHDGVLGFNFLTTALRLACLNMLLALARDNLVNVTVKHNGDVDEKIRVAAAAISKSKSRLLKIKEEGDALAKQPMTYTQMTDVLAHLLPTDVPDLSDQIVRNREVAKDAIKSIFVGETEQNTRGNAPGTKWCAWNACTEYHQWFRRNTINAHNLSSYINNQAFNKEALKLIKAA